jgi:pimeloyl-ACP methyl ester carboxylesterase
VSSIREAEEIMQYFSTEDGIRLAYRDEGQGVPILALAGLTRDGRDFDYLQPHLTGVRLIRLDSRGRGASNWADPATYSVPQEAKDALALLDHLGLQSAAIIGSSRGGLIGMLIAATARDRLTGLCLNDVGPVLDRDGLERIGSYVGIRPIGLRPEDAAHRLAVASSGFDNVPMSRWQEEADRRFVAKADGVDLTYDPALRESFTASMAAPSADLWPLFDACAGLPLALIRGANSDLLMAETARQMLERQPDMLFAEIPGRAHIPFLDEPEALACIHSWIGRLQV